MALGAGVVLSVPLWPQRHPCCDACLPDSMREDAFRTVYLHPLVRGEIARREAMSFFVTDSSQPIWLALDVATASVTWRTLQLEQNRPKEQGSVSLASVAAVSSVTAASAPGSTASSPPPSTANAQSIRLVDGRGRLLLQVGFTEPRSAQRWMNGLSEAVALSRMANSALFGAAVAATVAGAHPSGADASAGGADARGGSAASAAAREARAREREAFRARLGSPGMANTAAAAMRLQEKAGAGRQPRGLDPAAAAAAAAAEEDAVNADIDDAVAEAMRRAGRAGTSAGAPLPPSRQGDVGRSAAAGGRPLNGVEAAAAHTIRTGNLDADRAIHAAVVGARNVGSSMTALWSRVASAARPAVAAVVAAPPPGGGTRDGIGRGSAHVVVR